MHRIFGLIALSIGLAGSLVAPSALAFEIEGNEGTVLIAEELGKFDEPWAMAVLPDGRMLVTEKAGRMLLVSSDGQSRQAIRNVPKVDYGGQGGMGDVVIHPDFTSNNLVYFSFAEAGSANSRGAAVARAILAERVGNPVLENVEVIWRQMPKVTGRGHYGHRIAFDPDGKLFITSSDRQKLDPAQDMNSSLGKIIRLNEDGSVPPDNPWQDQGDLARTFWSIGHRNALGIAFDVDGRLWQSEMGPRHGDELNIAERGRNYGWPLVSNGNHYSGANIPDHDTDPSFESPKEWWVPSIAPSGLVIYDGDLFADWQGDALIGGLVSRALILVDLEGDTAEELERFEWGKRVREVEQAPDGAVFVLEDRKGGRLLRLTPAD
jgi:glucose/arabinose dehydrogenase